MTLFNTGIAQGLKLLTSPQKSMLDLILEDLSNPQQLMNPEVSTVTPNTPDSTPIPEIEPITPPGSYVKHAMRNMVRKRGKSLQHFFLSTLGMLALFIGLAYITR